MNTILKLIFPLVLFALTFSACQQQSIEDLNAKWVNTHINQQIIETNAGFVAPSLTIIVSEKSVKGTDGCNRYMGLIDSLSNQYIHFGPLASSRMMCPDMKIADSYSQALYETRYYKVSKDILYLLDKDHKEILQFSKAQ